MKKHFLSLLLAILLLTVLFAARASADSGTCGPNLTWDFSTISGKQTLTISGTGPMTSTPWNYDDGDGVPVIEKLILNEGVTSICDNAFSVACSVTSITIPNSVQTIGSNVFGDELRTLTLGSGVQFINYTAFNQAILLNRITVASDNPYFSSKNYILYSKDGKTLLYVPTTWGGVDFSFTVPSGTEVIGTRFYHSCNVNGKNYAMTSVTIPTSVKIIETDAFSDSRLETLTLKATELTSLGANALIGFNSITYYGGERSFWAIPGIQDAIPSRENVIITYRLTDTTGVTLDTDEATLTADATRTLTATVEPSSASNKLVSWSSSDTSVAIVNSSGVVRAVAPGTAIITVTTNDGGFTASCVVKVPVPVSSVSLDQTSLTLPAGKSQQLTAVVYPEDADDKSVIWISGDESVVQVDESGLVTAVGSGTAAITVTTNDGAFTADCTVTVVTQVTGVTLSQGSDWVWPGRTLLLNATVSPEDATDKSVTWYTDDANIATVDETGLVTGVNPGTVTITVMTNDGTFTAERTLLVVTPVTGVSLDQTEIELIEGESAQLSATVTPADATRPEIDWMVYNPQIVRLNDNNGSITALLPGTTTVSVTSVDGQYTAECIVTVLEAAADSGTCGENVNWEYYVRSKRLVISGQGAMYDYGTGGVNEERNIYTNSETRPWNDYRTQIQTILVEPGVTRIGNFSFSESTALTSVTLPDTLQEIGIGAFFNCEYLPEISIPASVSEISAITFFNGRALQHAQLLEGLTSIGASAFDGCVTLAELNLPSTMTDIGEFAFRDCYAPTELTIPASVEEIGDRAFQNWQHLETITFEGSMPNVAAEAFLYDAAEVYYPFGDPSYNEESMLNYGGTLSWRNGSSTLSFDANGGTDAPEDMSVIIGETVSLPSGKPVREGWYFLGWALSEQGESPEYRPGGGIALEADTTLYAVWIAPDFVLPSALVTVEEEAFKGGAFFFVKLPENTREIQRLAFADCPNLTYIYIPEGTTTIDKDAFGDQTNLTIYGITDSYAEFYALRHGFDFVAVTG